MFIYNLSVRLNTCKNENRLLAASSLYPVTVELEGIEPSSKRGNHELSTRLSRPSVFEDGQDPGHQSVPYPLKIHPRREAAADYLRFSCTTLPDGFGARASE